MISRKFFRYSVLLVVAMVMAGCANTTRLSQQPPEEAAPGDVEYTIGAGDTLQIHVRNNPDLSVTLPVRPDGKVSVPMVQDVQAAGQTPSQLAQTLETNLSEFVRSPTVTVMVTDFVGAYTDQVRILGEAAQPRALSYRQGMTVLDAIIQVGGLTQFAAGNRAKLIRKTNGETKAYPVRLDDLVNEGDISANIRLYPGDVLLIPEAYF